MTREQNADRIISKVLVREGGVAQVSGESFVTRFGQTPEWLQTFGFRPPNTSADAADNYRLWLDKTGLIEVCEEADALADVVIDFAVHAGHGAATRALQAAIGVRPDGTFGPATAGALVTADRRAVAHKVLADRLRQLGTVITSKPEKYGRYGRGWMARIAEQIEGLS